MGFSLRCVWKADSKEQVGRKSFRAPAALLDLCIGALESTAYLREAAETCALHV